MKAIFKTANKAIDLIDKVIPDGAEKIKLKGEIIKAEIESDSKYLKGARPTVIYVGLFLILAEYFGLRNFLINIYYTDAEMINKSIESSEKILEYFLVTWGSVATAFVISRSGDKKNRKILK